ncbi:GFA family protein [Cohaesibacter gelatinilyticus]|uniref:GFA family protein n=1 Tax=Cohaesibacter gelatinilyticus TaxID=372072 RepID=UPI000BE41341
MATVTICHCEDRQTISGTAFRTFVPTPSDDICFSGSGIKTYIKIGSSGARREQAFCSTCGSAIHATGEGPEPKIYNLRVGVMKEKTDLLPKIQKFLRSSLPWLQNMKDIPGLNTQ